MVKRYSAKWVGRMMLALLFNTLLFAQTSTTEGKITGVVTDAATGEALIGAA